jgi:hypothetical protein
MSQSNSVDGLDKNDGIRYFDRPTNPQQKVRNLVSSDLSKTELYEGVKLLLETHERQKHLHLNQHKLFTLFSLAFQYLLFCSTKQPGAYIIRAEDSHLADKLARKAKDPSTRKFMASLLIPRKLKYGNSLFFLDFFHLTSWNLTKDIPPEKVKAALIIKNTSTRPMNEMGTTDSEEEDQDFAFENLPENYFLSSLVELAPKTMTIAFESVFPELETLEFPFIKKDKGRTVSGVTLGRDLDWDEIDS